MANKKNRKKVTEKPERQVSKQEKEMFSFRTCAHGPRGQPVDWDLIKAAWNF